MLNLYTEIFESDLQSRLRNPEASFALTHWTVARRNRPMPELEDMSIASIGWLKQDVMIIRKDAAGELFYFQYGDRIARHAGFDMTGKYVSEFKGALGAFFAEIYVSLFKEPRAIGTVHRLGNFKERPLWERVLLPVSTNGSMDSIYVVNRILDLGHEFKLAAARARSSGIIALQFERDGSGQVHTGTIIGANKMAQTLCNRRLDEMVGASMHACFPGIVEKGLWQKYLDVSASQQPCNFTLGYDLDGMSGTYDVTLSPFRDGILIDFILSSPDV